MNDEPFWDYSKYQDSEWDAVFFFSLFLAFNELAYYFATSEKNLASYSFANIWKRRVREFRRELIIPWRFCPSYPSGVFKTQRNIYDRVFSRKIVNG